MTSAEAPRDLQVFVVPYCHADWAWTHTRHWHAERYTLVFEETLALLRAQEAEGVSGDDPHAYRWYIDSFVTMLQPFLERRPDLLPELRRWVDAGRIAICGAFANVRPNCVEGEAFLRNLVLGRRAFQALFPQADLAVHADLVDVAWGHPQLPQLLALAGYRYLRGWRPHEALSAKGVPHHFVWRGLDGTEVLCSRGSYGALVHPSFVPPDYRERWDAVVRQWWRYELQEKLERSPVPLLWLAHGADDNRPLRTLFDSDAPLDLPGFIQEWNRRGDSRMRFATPVEVFAALEARRGDLPLVAETLDPCDVTYSAALGGGAGLWRRRREAARALLLAETLTAIAALGGAAPREAYPQTLLEELWRAALTCSCHATQWLFQEDFAAMVELAQVTTRQAGDLATRAAGALAQQVMLPDRALAVVVNPLPYERTVAVPLLVSFVEADRGGVPAGLRLVDGRGQDVPYQVQSELRYEGIVWELEVLARLILPAGGWNTVGWDAGGTAAAQGRGCATEEGHDGATRAAERPPAAQPARLVLENDLLRVELDQGRVVRIVDRETGRADVAPAGTPYGHLRAYAVDPTAALHAGPVVGEQDVEWLGWAPIETGPVRRAAFVEGRVGVHHVRVEIRLPAGEPRIEFETTVEWDGQDGFLAFHVPLPAGGELWGGIPYGAERKDLAREPYVGFERSRPGMFWAQDFVDWSDGSRGVACIPHDGDVYYLFDDSRGVLGHVLINSFRRDRGTWEKHVNREIEGRGRHTFVASLVWHAGDWREAGLWALARSLTVPPIVVRRRRGAGTLPPVHCMLAVEPATVCLAALYREGTTTLVRIHEMRGEETVATVTLPGPAGAVTAVSPLNEPRSQAGDGSDGSEPTLTDGGHRVTCRLRPWQIRTIAVHP
jgi:alpha-mannosidase